MITNTHREAGLLFSRHNPPVTALWTTQRTPGGRCSLSSTCGSQPTVGPRNMRNTCSCHIAGILHQKPQGRQPAICVEASPPQDVGRVLLEVKSRNSCGWAWLAQHCNPSFREAEAERACVQELPGNQTRLFEEKNESLLYSLLSASERVRKGLLYPQGYIKLHQGMMAPPG